MIRGDCILVKNLVVKGLAGRDAWQRALAQPLRVSLRIDAGNRFRQLALTDDLRRTLNYDALCTQLATRLETTAAPSIEHAARAALQEVAPLLLPNESAELRLEQPKAVLQAGGKSVTVTTASTRVTESLRALQLPAIIGVNALERVHRQQLRIDVDVERDAENEVFVPQFLARLEAHVLKSRWLTVESFANDVARLFADQPVARVTLRVAKPSALNLADAAAVQVTRTRQELAAAAAEPETCSTGDHVVYIAFGTNVGDRFTNVRRAIPALAERGVRVEQASQMYESEPMYFADQQPFVNGVFRCRTALDPHELLAALKDVEYNAFGRVKLFDNGPRSLDLDIILYDNEHISTPTLTVPHRDMLNRPFVLAPLHDVMPHCTFPRPTHGMYKVLPLVGEQYLKLNQTLVMAIMNATPDSFSDGNTLRGRVAEIAEAHARNGAHILDIGGYSTRPGASEVGEAEEIARVCSAIEEAKRASGLPISIDTFRASVAEAAITAGASIINDVFSGMQDARIFEVAGKHGVPLVLSHSRGTPQTMRGLAEYEDLIPEVARELGARIDAARAHCHTWQLVLDPGLGFAKTASQDLELVKRFSELAHLLPLPWLVGPSRKSFLRPFVDRPPAQRDAATVAVCTALAQQGADIVRVHDSAAAGAMRVADALYRT